jgi:hypothetical protein
MTLLVFFIPLAFAGGLFIGFCGKQLIERFGIDDQRLELLIIMLALLVYDILLILSIIDFVNFGLNYHMKSLR